MTLAQLRTQAARVLGANSTRSTAGQLASMIIDTIPEQSTEPDLVELNEAMNRLAEELTVETGSHFTHPGVRQDIALVLRALERPIFAVQKANMTELEQAVDKIRLAIENEGPAPYVHRRIMGGHRREWPALWRAIDNVLKIHEREFRSRIDPEIT